MKELSPEEMKTIEGGIACSQLTAVLQHVARENIDQFHAILETFAVFGHGGTYELQCDP